MSNEYTIKYVSDVTQAANGIEQLIGLVKVLGAEVDKVAPKLASLAKGAVSPVNAAAKALDKLGTSAGTLDERVAKAAVSVADLGKAAAVASGQTSAAGNAVSSLGTRPRRLKKQGRPRGRTEGAAR